MQLFESKPNSGGTFNYLPHKRTFFFSFYFFYNSSVICFCLSTVTPLIPQETILSKRNQKNLINHLFAACNGVGKQGRLINYRHCRVDMDLLRFTEISEFTEIYRENFSDN